MGISLHDATVDRYLQTLGGLDRVLAKGRAHFTEAGLDLQAAADTRLWADMHPLSYQVVAATHHSLGAVNAVIAGAFAPPETEPVTYDRMEALVAETRQALQALDPATIDALAEKPVVFKGRNRDLTFTGSGFLLSFSLPNFYFHASTAYDILRSRGVPLAKGDYMGALRLAG